MKILIHGPNFYPEVIGVGKYTDEMASWFSSLGHDVRVVTAPPYYPAWRVSEDYRSYLYKLESRNGVKVYRCPLWVPKKPTSLSRIVHLLSFALSSFPVMLRQVSWRPNFVWVVEPTLLCAANGLLVARLSGSKAWLHIQDFEVDAALDLGLLKISFLRRWIRVFEGWIMRRFDRVSTISNRMVERTIRKGVRAQSTILFPNWVDTSLIRPLKSANNYRHELGISDEMVVALYSGNMGNKQGLDILAEVAKSLQYESKICFVFCGNGSEREVLVRACAALENVRFMDLQPLNRLNELLNLADIHLLPQRADAADLVMPSKVTGMLASGKAIIATAHEGTELAAVVRESGLVVPPEQPDEFSDAILRLAGDPQLRKTLGRNGRVLAERELSKDVVLGRFLENIRNCIDGPGKYANQGTKPP